MGSPNPAAFADPLWAALGSGVGVHGSVYSPSTGLEGESITLGGGGGNTGGQSAGPTPMSSLPMNPTAGYGTYAAAQQSAQTPATWGPGIPGWVNPPIGQPGHIDSASGTYGTPLSGSSQMTGSQQAQALANPTPSSNTTPVQPMEATAFNTANQYSQGLASGQNDMINRQLMQARDQISQGVRSEGQAAGERGADPSLFQSRAQNAGTAYLGQLQGSLTSDALQAQAAANQNLTSAAGTAATTQLENNLGQQAQNTQDQRTLDEQASLQAQLNQAPYDRLSNMMNQVANVRNDYQAITPQGPRQGGSQYSGNLLASNPSVAGWSNIYGGGTSF